MIMKEGVILPDICMKLLNGENIEGCSLDLIKVDNMLYDAFGMSSEDILAELWPVPDECE